MSTRIKNSSTEQGNTVVKQGASSRTPSAEAKCRGRFQPTAVVSGADQPVRFARFQIADDAGCSFDHQVLDSAVALSILPDELGMRTQCSTEQVFSSACELTIGFDFGTSNSKVAIGDRQLGKSYAVPFREGSSIQRYLMPARLFSTRGVYSLVQGSRDYRDLKLSLLADPENEECQIRVVAYIALVIRHVRAWLYTEYADVYRNKEIFWSLQIGLPFAYKQDTVCASLFDRLALAAWRAAGKGGVSTRGVRSILEELDPENLLDDDPEVNVTPEIAAQIYGFVVSDSFDARDKNIFMMADIGAGSLDSAIFHVRQEKGNKWSFHCYLAVVRPLGVSNLHRERISWWEKVLKQKAAPSHLAKQLTKIRYITDLEKMVPNSYTDYFSGIKFRLQADCYNPDWNFGKAALGQVKSDTQCKVVTGRLASWGDVAGVPFIVCGGGARMEFYQDRLVEGVLKPAPGHSRLYAKERFIPKPRSFVAKGVQRRDYDRLLVAYGLSQLELKSVEWVKPLRTEELLQDSKTYRDDYVDKDHM